jgi:hypothetical protein
LLLAADAEHLRDRPSTGEGAPATWDDVVAAVEARRADPSAPAPFALCTLEERLLVSAAALLGLRDRIAELTEEQRARRWDRVSEIATEALDLIHIARRTGALAHDALEADTGLVKNAAAVAARELGAS